MDEVSKTTIQGQRWPNCNLKSIIYNFIPPIWCPSGRNKKAKTAHSTDNPSSTSESKVNEVKLD